MVSNFKLQNRAFVMSGEKGRIETNIDCCVKAGCEEVYVDSKMAFGEAYIGRL